ncbi:hypothetical protein [Psychrobacter cryohalolentis]|uniref:Uncharacterized protein n=1 Tax=Psychrobacter cryohalolentis (strain ATCC BAA-1226 / DSM 17306 / VKM B-2378 / K5) TaxID=335284 RepID=Q1QEL4_PSYCK|nr:hypothetical protein [Psychrobacter cryohalolentis]ABE73889.1 conserved hypothetical protein [Psychrobacter cryohalolentis K5]ASE26527.1 hypothetical protein CEP87_08020 [Psychrobacter cryohalolentis]
MFKFWVVEHDNGVYGNLTNKGIECPQHSNALLAAALTGVLLLSGCQQQAAEENVADKPQTSEQTSEEDSQPMAQSDSAAARIEQFQPLYVTQFQALQGRLQAEYESLQAADIADSENALLVDEPTVATGNNQPANNSDQGAIAATPQLTQDPVAAAKDAANGNSVTDTEINDEINTSTEVGERDLTVLKRISLEPRKPMILTEKQIIERYEQAMEALYQPVTTPLNAQDTDTLINIATLVPQLFEDAEIAGRVSAKSPALARLIIQHQVWEQIEAQQVLDMQKMKQTQQQEFEMLMAKFNETIEGYDEQIAKYEQTLKEFK